CPIGATLRPACRGRGRGPPSSPPSASQAPVRQRVRASALPGTVRGARGPDEARGDGAALRIANRGVDSLTGRVLVRPCRSAGANEIPSPRLGRLPRNDESRLHSPLPSVGSLPRILYR